MLAPSETTRIWDFALAFYAQPGVEVDCLLAQEEHCLEVTALIFALYRAHMGRGFEPEEARTLASSMSLQITQPLRQVRISLKTPLSALDPMDAEALRQDVKRAELASERVTLEALDRLPNHAAALPLDQALFAMAQTRTSAKRGDLEALLKRLAICAQNM